MSYPSPDGRVEGPAQTVLDADGMSTTSSFMGQEDGKSKKGLISRAFRKVRCHLRSLLCIE